MDLLPSLYKKLKMALRYRSLGPMLIEDGARGKKKSAPEAPDNLEAAVSLVRIAHL